MISVIITHDNYMVNTYLCIAAVYNPYSEELSLRMEREYMKNNHLYIHNESESNKYEDYFINTKEIRSIKIDGQEILVYNFFEKVWIKIRDLAKRNNLWI